MNNYPHPCPLPLGEGDTPAEMIVEFLTGMELYRELSGLFESKDGNLFEKSDPVTIAAQVKAIEYAVERCQPRTVLETGTNKGYFGYVIDLMRDHMKLYTFDIDERAGMAAAALGDGPVTLEVVFTPGDTRQTLAQFNKPIDLAWIDGGHEVKTAYNDICHAMRLGARWILIDDAKEMATVTLAIKVALDEHQEYSRVLNPFWAQDRRGIAMLKRGR